MSVGEILVLVFGITVIVVGVPILLPVVGVFLISIVLDVLDWIEDRLL